MQGDKLEALVENIAVELSDKIILRLDVREDDPRLSRMIDELRDDLRAALTQPVDGGEFVMVPREATEAMMVKGYAAYQAGASNAPDLWQNIWAAMIAASPSRPSPSPEQREVAITRDLIDRQVLKSKLDDLIVAARNEWGVGSTEHNLIRDISDVIVRVPAALYPDRVE